MKAPPHPLRSTRSDPAGANNNKKNLRFTWQDMRRGKSSLRVLKWWNELGEVKRVERDGN
jgi:hypothetical protein